MNAAVMSDVLRMGYEARYHGAGMHLNPFPQGGHQYTEWRNGWLECDRELKGEQ